MRLEMKRYIARVSDCCYQTRYAILVEDQNIEFLPSESDRNLMAPRPADFLFCLSSTIGITSQHKASTITFVGKIDPDT